MKNIKKRIALALAFSLIVTNVRLGAANAFCEEAGAGAADLQFLEVSDGNSDEQHVDNVDEKNAPQDAAEGDDPSEDALLSAPPVQDAAPVVEFYYQGEKVEAKNNELTVYRGKELYALIRTDKYIEIDASGNLVDTEEADYKYLFNLNQGKHTINIAFLEMQDNDGGENQTDPDQKQYQLKVTDVLTYVVTCMDDTQSPIVNVKSDEFKGDNITPSKDEMSYLIDGSFRFDFQVKDEIKQTNGSNDPTEYASGIKEIKLFCSKINLDGSMTEYEPTITENDNGYSCEFPADGEYYIDRIEAKDYINEQPGISNVKKKIYVENLSEQKSDFLLDAGTAWRYPASDDSQMAEDYSDAWYSFTKYKEENLFVTVSFYIYGEVDPDFSLKTKSGSVIKPISEVPNATTRNRVKNQVTVTYMIDATKEQDNICTFSYFRFDEKEKKKMEIPIRIDNTAPTGTFEAGFVANSDKYYVEIPDAVKEGDDENASYQYSIAAAEGKVVTKDDKLAVSVKSKDAADNSSGIARMLCKYTVDDAEIEQPIEGIINGGSDVKASGEIVFAEGQFSEHTFRISSVVLEDIAGNTYELLPERDDDKVSYEVDSLAPRIDESFLGDAVTIDSDGTMYFGEKFSQDIGITDKNFDSAQLMAVGAEAKPNFNKKKGSSGDANTYEIEFANDGRYEYYIYAKDKVNNETPVDSKEKDAAIRKVVIDSAEPKIDIRYEAASGKVSAESNTENYTGSDVSVVITITEANIAEDGISVDINGEDLRGGDKSRRLSVEDFELQDDKYVATCNITEEGRYSVTAAAKDKSGHRYKVEAGKFVIDKTEPKWNVSFDNNEAVNEHYYKDKRVATIKVEDLSFDENSVDLNVESLGNAPALSPWSEDEGVYTATLVFSEDGKYKFDFSCSDKAGNDSKVYESEEFFIDRTKPQIKVDFDNNTAENEFYYNKARTATINIEDISFDDKAVTITPLEGEGFGKLPEATAFSGGDINHKANITFAEDGKYGFEISCKDLAGNDSEKVSSGTFIIDTTFPEVKITGVEDKSANNGVVAPVITYTDKNVDTLNSGVSAVGKNNGDISSKATLTKIADGYTAQMEDFPHEKKYDDVYVISAKVRDFAGNEANEEIMFSVNRFGSVYYIDDNTEKTIADYYTNVAPEISITEVNIDELEWRNVSVSRDGEIKELKAGKDYTVSETENDKSWKSFTYTIKDKNFKKDGNYSVVISSKDKAANEQDNVVRDKEIEFAVDGTEPGIAVSGLKNNGVYEAESHQISFNVTDNMGVTGATVYENDEVLCKYSADQLKNDGYTEQIVLEAMNERRNIKIVSTDVAGNEGVEEFKNIIVALNADVVKAKEEEELLTPPATDEDAKKKAIPRNKSIPVIPIAGGSTAVVVGGYALFEFLRKRKR